MPFIYRSMFAINDINNGTLSFKKAMPQKDITSVNEDEFAMDRRHYIKTLPTADTTQFRPQKKWYGNRDASQVTVNRRVTSVGVGSLNANNAPMSFTTFKDVNTVNNALTRVRAGGATVPAKVRAKTTNNLTPTWPVGNLVQSNASEYPIYTKNLNTKNSNIVQFKQLHPVQNKTAMFGKPISENVIKLNH
jgi:hypothetical protein